jgi:hypothetical protein
MARLRRPTLENVFTFAEFKAAIDRANLNIEGQSLLKSYQGLNQLRKRKNLSWLEMKKKAHVLANELQVQLLKNPGQLKAARIPLTDRDWERI